MKKKLERKKAEAAIKKDEAQNKKTLDEAAAKKQSNMVSSMIVNLFKVSFSKFFIDEQNDDLCYQYYNTSECGNKNGLQCIKNKDFKKECMLSVLLFYFIYTIIKEDTNLHYKKISFFFNFLKTQKLQKIDETLVQTTLNYTLQDLKDQKDIDEENKKIILQKMLQLKTLLVEVKQSLFDGSFFPHLYYSKFDKNNVVGPDLIYKYPEIVINKNLVDSDLNLSFRKPNYEIIKKQFLSDYSLPRIKRPPRPEPRPTHPSKSEDQRPPRPPRPDRPPRPGKEILQDFLTRTLNKKLNVILITQKDEIKTITALKGKNLTIKTQDKKEEVSTIDSLFDDENTYEVFFLNAYEKDADAGIAGIAGGNGNNYKHKTKKLKLKNKKIQITSKKYKGYQTKSRRSKKYQTKSRRSKGYQTKSRRSKGYQTKSILSKKRKIRKKLLNITHKII